ncbi:uncharacterized [Tachysurus ichikawai]
MPIVFRKELSRNSCSRQGGRRAWLFALVPRTQRERDPTGSNCLQYDIEMLSHFGQRLKKRQLSVAKPWCQV